MAHALDVKVGGGGVRLLVCVGAACLAARAWGDSAESFTTLADWNAATTTQTLVATFSEPMWPVGTLIVGPRSLNGVTYEGHAGLPSPNIWVLPAASSPLTGQALTANGDEDIDLTLNPLRTAIAFDVAVNQFGPVTIRVFNQQGDQIASFDRAASTIGFQGIVSDVPIGRVNFRSVLGAVRDSVLDNVRLGDALPMCPACAADYDNNGGVDGGDLAAFFADFESGEACADVDQNGGVDGGDLAYFFEVFEAGGC
jgi:hypothetical protein